MIVTDNYSSVKNTPCAFISKVSVIPPYSEKDTKQFVLVTRRSPGFGLTLVAETLNGFFLSAEMSSTPQGQGDPILPEDLGLNCAKLLLEEIHRVSTAETLTYTHVSVFEVNRRKKDRFSCFSLESDLF